MSAVRTPPDAALTQLPDEALVLLVQQHGHRHPATQTLLLRHLAWIRQRAGYIGRRCHVPRDAVPDLQQEAILAALVAVHDYVQGAPCAFRSFLWTVVGRRCVNFARNLRRSAARQAQAVSREQTRTRRVIGNPAADLAVRELWARVERLVGGLDPQARQLWERVSDGGSVRALATELGVLYHQLKRRLTALRKELAAQVLDWAG
jgi:RNA polymerase sigma factor (sigma-70 family)